MQRAGSAGTEPWRRAWLGQRARRTAALAATLLALGCTGSPQAPPGARSATPPASRASPMAEVTIETFQFRPGRVTVPVGARVRWTNHDDVQHTVTGGTPERPTGRFHGTLDGKGATFDFAPDRTGIMPYFCARHPHMRGELVVRPEGR